MEIRNLNNTNSDKYIKELVNIHLNSFTKDHFTSSFNNIMLGRYYSYLIKYSDLSFIIINKNLVCGFLISGCTVDKGVNKFIRNNFLYVFTKFVFNYKYVLERIKSFSLKKTNYSEQACFRLYAIATTPVGEGYGRSLLKHLELELISIGIIIYGLSVRRENINALDFYLHNGFFKVFEDNSKINLVKKL
jgi:GNAT superfamily N-acetyltransferase